MHGPGHDIVSYRGCGDTSRGVGLHALEGVSEVWNTDSMSSIMVLMTERKSLKRGDTEVGLECCSRAAYFEVTHEPTASGCRHCGSQ